MQAPRGKKLTGFRMGADANGDPHGFRISLGTISACGLNSWWPDIRRDELAERARSGQGWEARPRSVAPRGLVQGFYRGGIESIW